MNKEEFKEDTTTQVETLNTEKQEPPNWIERQNNKNRNATPS